MSNFTHLWIVFSLLSAFFQASRIAVTKHLSFNFSARALTFFVNFASLCITLPLIVWHHDFPLHQPRYVAAVLAGAVLSGLGGWSFNYAIKTSEISIVGPLITLTPGFVIIIEWLLLGDIPSEMGFLGIGLLCGGSYVLTLSDDADSGRPSRHWFRPLRKIVANSGSRFALLASLCFACASVLGREAIRMSEPVSFAVMVAIVNPVVLFTLFSLHDRGFYKELIGNKAREHLGALALLGGLFALMRLADQIALSMTLASYAMALKRMAGVFSVIIGHYLFREPRMPVKLVASVIMVLGVVTMIGD